MSENGSAAMPATPSNFSATIAANVARAAPAAAPAPSNGNGAPVPSAAPQDAGAAFDAAIMAQQQAPANDNAQAVDPNAELAALQGEQPPDPFAEEIHGLQLRAIVDAIKQGQLPSELLEQLKVVAKVNDRELPISVEEARRGYMRLSDYTQSTQRAADVVQQTEQVKAQLRGLFEGWDKPEGFEQGMFRMGLVPHARALVTKNWGTQQQPNPQGMLDDMRRLGHWDTFVRAAELYADQWSAEQKMEPHVRTELQRQRDAMWQARLAAEQEVEASKRKAWEQERDQLLRERQQRPNPQAQQASLQQIHDMKTQAFTQSGVKPSPAADKYFVENYAAIVRNAQRRGERLSIPEIVRLAAQSTAEQLGDIQYQHQRATSAPQQAAAPAQQAPAQQQPALSARPAAAPVTAPSPLKRSGTPEDFLERLQTLNAMTKR